MSNISKYGYESIQNYVANTFIYLELQDSTGAFTERFGVSDGLVITNDTENKIIEYKLTVKGDSTFINQEVSKTAIFNSSDPNQPFASDTFTSFTFEQAEDELTVIHTITLPTGE